MVLEYHLAGVVLPAGGGRVGRLTRFADVVGIGVPEVGHGPAPLHLRWGWGNTKAPQAHPLRPRPTWGRGGRDPTPASKRGGCSVPGWMATCPRRSRRPSFGGIRPGPFSRGGSFSERILRWVLLIRS